MSVPSNEAAPGTPSSNASPSLAVKSQTWTPASNSWLAILIFSGVILAGVLLVLAAWRLPPFATAVERTDDAYVQGLTTVISPQVSGYVSNVPVGDFANVTRGALLLQIDPSTYAAQVQEAKAQVEAKRSEQENNQEAVAQARADLEAATASVSNAQAQLARSEGDLRRTTDLVRDGSVSARENDQNIAAVRQTQAALVEARANAQKAAEQIRTQEVNGRALSAGVDQAQAQLKAVQLQLDRTRIFAPDTGQLSQVGVRLGQYVTAGTPLFYLVPGPRWISANFKETQTRRMAPGQAAWFTVDALGSGSHPRPRLAPVPGGGLAIFRHQARQRHRQLHQGATAHLRGYRRRPRPAAGRPAEAGHVGGSVYRYKQGVASTMIRRRLAVLLPPLLLTTSACLGPRPSLPPDAAVATPAQWRFDAGPVAPIDAAWWRVFNDPVLADLVERALIANPDIQQAAARVMQARAAEHEVRAARGPDVSFMNLGGKIRELEVVGPVTTPGDEAEVTVSWDFDIFHQLAHADKARRAELLAMAATRDAVKLSVASTVASDYIALLGADARVAIARTTLAARARSLAFARRRAAVGYTSRLELQQAEAEYRSTEQMIPEAELAVAQREDALSILIGEPPQAVPRSAAGLDGLDSPPIPDGLPSSLLRRRPDIYAAEEQMVAADHTLSSARAAMLPKFSLTAYYNDVYAPILPMIENQYLYAGQIMAPIFDSGRRKAVADQAAAARNEAAYAYRGAVLTAVREVDDALAGVQKLTAQSKSQQDQVTALNHLLALSARRYQEGYTPYFDQLDAQRQLLTAQLSLAQTRTQRLSAYVKLYQAMGGGWSLSTIKP